MSENPTQLIGDGSHGGMNMLSRRSLWLVRTLWLNGSRKEKMRLRSVLPETNGWYT